MPLTTAATSVGKLVVTHAMRTWLGARQQCAERDTELIDLVRINVRDHLKRRKLVRQLEDLADEFRARYLTHVSETLDELEQFGIDVRRYKPRTLVSVAYLSLQVSTDPTRRGCGDRPDERWFIDGRRTVTSGSSSLRAEAALAESPRTLLWGDAGSGKTTLLQWLAVTAARSGFSGPLADWNGSVPFLVRLRSGDRHR